MNNSKLKKKLDLNISNLLVVMLFTFGRNKKKFFSCKSNGKNKGMYCNLQVQQEILF